MKKWMFAAGFVAVSTVVGVSFIGKKSLDISNSALDVSAIESPSNEPGLSDEAWNSRSASSESTPKSEGLGDDFISELIAKLKSAYSDNIHLLHIQASLIKVKEFVLQRYPSNGNNKFKEAILAAFPEHASSILALLSKLDIYQEWLVDNQADLLAESDQIQQGMIWEKRRELFGKDAEKIWAHELSGMNEQQTAMQLVIQTLDQAHDISMDEKLYQLQSAIADQLDGSVQNVAVTGGVVSKVFFTLNSVQSELASMDPAMRQEKINDIRSQLGLSEEQIERLQSQDQEREKRWVNGLAYMDERDQLLASVDEYSRSDALQELRTRYFGRDAVTIQREEESDFWRYKRPRLYGVN